LDFPQERTMHAPNPWYREPWTWVLIAGPALAVVGSLASAYIAIQGADPIVEDDYYQRGLHINGTLQRLHRAEELGLRASVEYDALARGAAVWAHVQSGQPLHDTTLRLRLIHPGHSAGDRIAVLGRVPGSPDTAPEFTGPWLEAADEAAPQATAGRPVNWLLTLESPDWQVQGDTLGRSDLRAR
jgi:hypothetical protein